MEQRRSLYSLIIWGSMLAVFIPVFFSGGGADTWTVDDARAVIAAAVFAIGYTSYFIMMRRTKANAPHEKDERDRLIQGKACMVALVSVLLYVFILSVVLYTVYGDTNAVPAGWMWFMAYSTIFSGAATASAVSLIYYRRGINTV